MSEPHPFDADTIAAAEILANVEYTPEERAQLMDALEAQKARPAVLRTLSLDNGQSPAERFDPRLPSTSCPAASRCQIPALSQPLPAPPAVATVELEPSLIDRITRVFDGGPRGSRVRISRLAGGGLALEMLEPAGMMFDLLPLSQTTFLIEGVGQRIALKLDPDDPARGTPTAAVEPGHRAVRPHDRHQRCLRDLRELTPAPKRTNVSAQGNRRARPAAVRPSS